MNQLAAKIESLLFVETRSVSFKILASTLGTSVEEVADAVNVLASARNTSDSGIHVLVHADKVELVSNPEFADIVGALLKEEMSSELTKPQLETLTIIAYRGPLTRLEVEQVRGVNCQIILRNLQMRGLIEETEGELVPLYTVTAEFLKTLGVTSLKDLPEYEAFHNDERITTLLAQAQSTQA